MKKSHALEYVRVKNIHKDKLTLSQVELTI